MNPQDLITQVRPPGEQRVSVEEQRKPKQVKKKKCFFSCCGSDPDEDTPKSDIELGKSNKTASSQERSYPDRDTLNSPRSGSSSSLRSSAPGRDDHLLPPIPEHKKGKKCLVLDLDETLVHSSFKPVDRSDFIVPVEIENQVHKVYVAKRPYVDDFLKKCGELFEVVVFTASLAKYADPVLDLLDIHGVINWRLFRESCSPFKGSYVKDMTRMGRDMKCIMIVDNSPHSYAFNPETAIPVETWFSDLNDTELRDMIPILEKLADPEVLDCREALKQFQISGIDALKKELEGYASEEDQYSSTEEDTNDSQQGETHQDSGTDEDSQSG